MPGPGDDASTQVQGVLETLLRKKLAGVVRPGTTAAIEHDVLVIRQFRRAQGQQVHRDVRSVRDRALRDLGRGSNVYQQQVLAIAEAGLQSFGIDLVDHVNDYPLPKYFSILMIYVTDGKANDGTPSNLS